MRYFSAFFAGAFCLTMAIMPAMAVNDTWTIDPSKSSIDFSLKFLAFAKANGDFTKVSGIVQYDGKRLADASVKADVALSTIDTKIAKRDEHLRTKDFFYVTKFPVASFKSTEVIPGEKNNFKIIGILNMHGISKTVTLNAVRQSETASDMIATANAVIKRNDFGIGNGLKASGIGNDVNLKLKMHLVRNTGNNLSLNEN